MEAASLNLPTTAAQANVFMTSMPESKDGILNAESKVDIKSDTVVKKESQEDSASGIVPTLQYAQL